MRGIRYRYLICSMSTPASSGEVPAFLIASLQQFGSNMLDYSITATGTSLKFCFMSNLQQSARPMARSFALLALPWRNLPFCRQQGLQPDSHAEHHVTTLTNIQKICYVAQLLGTFRK